MIRQSLTMAIAAMGVLGLLLCGLGCGPEYPRCNTDDHCAEQGEYCVDNMCRECAKDSHCGDDPCKSCNASNTCERQRGCCTSDADCPGGKCLMSGNKGQCVQCIANEDCTAGNVCKANQCVPDVECTTDAQCPPGKQCVQGSCVIEQCQP